MPRYARAAIAVLFIALLCVAVIVGATLTSRSAPTSAPPPPQTPKPIFQHAAFAGGRLWIHADDKLWSITPGVHAAEIESWLGDAIVIGMCAQDEALVTASIARNGAIFVDKRVGANWSKVAKLPRAEDHLTGLVCGPGGPIILTDRRLIPLDGAAPVVRLNGPGADGLAGSTILLTANKVFVGLDGGEWGGGLRQIDRKTGRVVVRERKATGATCDVPLDSGCDPVTGLVVAPWDPASVIATVGQQHLIDHGRVVLVSPDWIQSIHYGPCPEENFPLYCAEAFRGVARAGHRVLAISAQGLTSLGPEGPPKRIPLPPFESYGPFHVSFADPTVVLVGRAYNHNRVGMSGLDAVVSR